MLMVHDWRMRLRLLSKIAGRIPSSVSIRFDSVAGQRSACQRRNGNGALHHRDTWRTIGRCADVYSAFRRSSGHRQCGRLALALTVVIPHLPLSHLGAALERALETICVPYSKYKFAADLAWVIVPRLDCGSLRRLLERLWPGSHLHQRVRRYRNGGKMRCVQLEAADVLSMDWAICFAPVVRSSRFCPKSLAS